jgi:lambda family phage portal protein
MSVPNPVSYFASLRNDYDMSRASRFVRRRTGVAARGSSADYHHRSEATYYADIEQARAMDRNDGLVGILADRRVDNIVQQGFTLDPKTGSDDVDWMLWEKWQQFADDPDECDIAGEMCWQEMERHACRAESIDGDIVVVGTEDGPLQLLEAHLIQTKTSVPNTFLGVTTDQYRRRTHYHVLEEIDQFGATKSIDPIPVKNDQGVRQLFHVYNPKRVLQTRGVTQMAPIFSLSGMLEDINFAKLVQQQVVSCFAILKKRPLSNPGNPPSVDGYGESGSETTATGEIRQTEGIAPGMEWESEPGGDLSGFSPNVPNSEYFVQVRLILQIIGVNFGLPLCLVLMDGSETNFSGWRGAVDEARKGFVADQLNLVRRLHRPVYKWKVHQWIEKDAEVKKAFSAIGDKIFDHNWNLPTWSYIEPVADAEGDAVQLRNALTSPRRLHAARGKDWDEVSQEIVADNSSAIQTAMTAAQEINGQNPGQPPVTWRDLIPLPMPAGTTLTLQDPEAVKAQQAAQAGKEAAGSGGSSGEYSGLGRREWANNVKAIDDVLRGLTQKTMSETKARVFLSSLGMPDDKIEALITDARDGRIDNPEVLNG